MARAFRDVGLSAPSLVQQELHAARRAGSALVQPCENNATARLEIDGPN
jgi:hypothetical protein